MKDLPTSIGSLRRLQKWSSRHCQNLKMLSVASTSQLDRPQHSTSSQPLYSNKPEQSGHGPVLQLPSFLLVLEARYCTQLKEIDASNLRSLNKLYPEGSHLLKSILGLKNTSNNLESFVLPAPACTLSNNLKENVSRYSIALDALTIEYADTVFVVPVVDKSWKRQTIPLPQR